MIKPQTINERKKVATHFIHIPCKIYRSQFSCFMIFHNDPQIGFVMTSFYEYVLIKCPFSFIENYIVVLVGFEIKESIYIRIYRRKLYQFRRRSINIYFYTCTFCFNLRTTWLVIIKIFLIYLFDLIHLTSICEFISLFQKEVKKWELLCF